MVSRATATKILIVPTSGWEPMASHVIVIVVSNVDERESQAATLNSTTLSPLFH